MHRLPHLSGSAVERALERLGFQRTKQEGSHVLMRRGMQVCIVPLHAEMKIATLAGLLRQANVTTDEFVASLDR